MLIIRRYVIIYVSFLADIRTYLTFDHVGSLIAPLLAASPIDFYSVVILIRCHLYEAANIELVINAQLDSDI